MWNRPEDENMLSGDDGLTSLAFGERVPKTHTRIVVIGDLEELLCHIGLLFYETQDGGITRALEFIQYKIDSIIEEFRNPDVTRITERDVEILEEYYSQATDDLEGPMCLAEGHKSCIQYRLAGTVCRRAERHAWKAYNFSENQQGLNKNTLAFLNRLSDFLFAVTL